MSVEDVAIPPDQWQAFCDDFTRQHRGWRVTVRRTDTPPPDQVGAAAPPASPLLVEASPLLEVRETPLEDGAEVLITVGRNGDRRSFLVENVVDLFHRRVGEAHQGLRLDSGDGTTTLVEFPAAAAPEALDGLSDTEL